MYKDIGPDTYILNLMKNIKQYTQQYKITLSQNVIPFWENHSPDIVKGGCFTCLDREGGRFR